MNQRLKSMAAVMLAAMMTVTTNAQVTAPDWENPAVLGIKKLPYHATLQLPSKEKACQEIISLDGKWLFHWSKNPDERPVSFYEMNYDVSQWGKITVPGNWQTQGYGIPIYINIDYPFVKNRPSVTTEPPKDWTAYENRNPVGSYVTFIDATEEMLGKNLILHFGGVHSAMYVWINGQKVGYSQNSMSPAEFDVTSYLKTGRNKLAVEVYRWSDGSYLEDQDMWRLSGIYRPVQLWVRPLTHISDYQVTAEPNHDYSEAAVKAKVSLCNTGNTDSNGLRAVMKIDGKELKANVAQIASGDTAQVLLNYTINRPHLWSAEKPSLYPFSVELQDEKGTVIEHFDYHLGVKKVEVVGEIFKINGKNVKLRGVNRHDHHPKTGRFVDDATYEQDIRLMKQANINFLRTSHYPDRKRSAFIGIYETSLKDYETDYVHPQDNGNRCDVRWFEIASPAGKFRIDGNQPLCIRAWDYGEEDLGVRHPNELPRGRFVNLNIDLDIHGVGGADTWGKRTLAPYTIDGNLSHHYSFILNP